MYVLSVTDDSSEHHGHFQTILERSVVLKMEFGVLRFVWLWRREEKEAHTYYKKGFFIGGEWRVNDSGKGDVSIFWLTVIC